MLVIIIIIFNGTATRINTFYVSMYPEPSPGSLQQGDFTFVQRGLTF